MQDLDLLIFEEKQRLAWLPNQVKKVQGQINAVKQEAEDARTGKQALERKRTDMRTERRTMEEKIQKYKTQQLSVKKNDEYQALTQEIENLTKRAGEIEEEEIQVLMDIDEQDEKLKEVDAVLDEKINALKVDLKNVEEEITAMKAKLVDDEKLLEAARTNVDASYLKAYDNVKTRHKKPPYLIPIKDHKVLGLRISANVEGQAREGVKPVICDNTGRMVYLP